LTNRTRDILARWKNKNYINKDNYNRIYCSDGVLPRTYGVSKIHKPEHPLRIIVSNIDSTLHAFSIFLDNIIYKSIPKPFSDIENTFQIVKRLEMFLGYDMTLISLVVVSMFTNISINMALENADNRWEYIKKNCSISKEEFMLAIELILESTYFTFDHKTYRQYFSTPMESPLSPIIANIVLEDLEERALQILGLNLPCYYR